MWYFLLSLPRRRVYFLGNTNEPFAKLRDVWDIYFLVWWASSGDNDTAMLISGITQYGRQLRVSLQGSTLLIYLERQCLRWITKKKCIISLGLPCRTGVRQSPSTILLETFDWREECMNRCQNLHQVCIFWLWTTLSTSFSLSSPPLSALGKNAKRTRCNKMVLRCCAWPFFPGYRWETRWWWLDLRVNRFSSPISPRRSCKACNSGAYYAVDIGAQRVGRQWIPAARAPGYHRRHWKR